jgi:hypothetical protein
MIDKEAVKGARLGFKLINIGSRSLCWIRKDIFNLATATHTKINETILITRPLYNEEQDKELPNWRWMGTATSSPVFRAETYAVSQAARILQWCPMSAAVFSMGRCSVTFGHNKRMWRIVYLTRQAKIWHKIVPISINIVERLIEISKTFFDEVRT